jgi:short-subunit dehydrogenase
MEKPRRALVTGASSGIGAALARRLAARGVEVWLAARRADALEAEVAAITKAGGRAHVLVLDVSDHAATASRLALLDEETGGIDLVVANAGGGKAELLAHTRWTDVRATFELNLVGGANTLMAFIPGMLARGHGQLVGISSIAAELPNPRGASYGAAKAGFTYFLESADMELRPRGIPVTIVHPGFVRTPAHDKTTFPLPFIVELERAAEIIDRGIARGARLVRFPWILSFVSRFTAWLPRAIMAPLIRRATGVK